MQQQGALTRAQIAFDAGEYSTALQHLDRARTYEAQHPASFAEIDFLRARCFEATNNPATAIAAYKLLLKNYPDTPAATKAKARLAELQTK